MHWHKSFPRNARATAWLYLAVALVACAAGGRAQAQEESGAKDLRAAYCARLLTLQIGLMDALPSQLAAGDIVQEAKLYGTIRATLSDMTARRDKFAHYVMGRAQFASASTLLNAAQQADLDFAHMGELAKRCQADGKAECAPPEDYKATFARCNDISWLPY